MKIIESFTQSKSNHSELNEDGIYTGTNYFAVVDGVTNKSEKKIWGPTPGVYVRKVIINALKDASETLTSEEMYRFLNDAILKCYGDKLNYFKTNSVDRLQVNLIVYSPYREEIWFYGDCQCLVDGVPHTNVKKIDILLGELRSFVYDAVQPESKGTGKDVGRTAILPFLKMQANVANSNSEFGYLVLDGIGFCPDKIKILHLDSSSSHEVVLASDGFPFLEDILNLTEQKLFDLKQKDPLLIREYKSTKGFGEDMVSFDDRSYLRFTTAH